MNKRLRTIKEKLDDEVTHSQGIYDLEYVTDKFITPKDSMKIIISHCIYNEEQFFEGVLYDDLKINDLDAIHILDGAWENFEGGYQSNDNTLEIINNFRDRAEKIGIKVIYEKHPENKIWESEPIKRNYQLKRIREIFGDKPYYNLVKDGDEFFHHLSGRQSTWMKKDLIEWIKYEQNIGLMNCNAFYSDISLMTPRLLPSTRNLHYYTGKSMVFHDENHNLVADFNPNIRNSGDPKLCFVYQNMMIINKFTIRNKKRQLDKEPFVDYIESQKGDTLCTAIQYEKLIH
jgi:hypothetical protein